MRNNEYKSAKMSARKAESCEAESKKRGFNPESGERQRVRKNEYKSTKMSEKNRHKPVRQNPESGDLIPESGERQRARQNPSQKTGSAS